MRQLFWNAGADEKPGTFFIWPNANKFQIEREKSYDYLLIIHMKKFDVVLSHTVTVTCLFSAGAEAFIPSKMSLKERNCLFHMSEWMYSLSFKCLSKVVIIPLWFWFSCLFSIPMSKRWTPTASHEFSEIGGFVRFNSLRNPLRFTKFPPYIHPKVVTLASVFTLMLFFRVLSLITRLYFLSRQRIICTHIISKFKMSTRKKRQFDWFLRMLHCLLANRKAPFSC